jgi:hypothetical protein
LAGFADGPPGAVGTAAAAAGGDHTNRQAVIMVVVLLALVTELSVPSKDGVKVNAVCARCRPDRMRNFPYL